MKRLGEVQKAVLLALDSNTHTDQYSLFEEEIAEYETVKEDSANYREKAVPKESHRAAFSRAVHSLIERGLIEGIFKGWCVKSGPHLDALNTGGNDPIGDGSSGRPSPKIQYLSLSADGKEVVESLQSEISNGGGGSP